MSLDSTSRQIIFKESETREAYTAPDYTSDFDLKVNDLTDLEIDAGHNGGNLQADGKMGMSKSLAGRKQAPISFWHGLKPSGALATAPKWFKLMKACGWKDTTATTGGGTNATIEWDGRPSCTNLSADLPLWECGVDPDGIADVMAGIAGSVTISASEVGAEIQLQFTMTGKVGLPKTLTTGSYNEPSGFDTGDNNTYLATTVTKGGVTYKAWNWDIAQNADVQSVNNASDSTNGADTGIDYFKVANASPEGSFNVTRISGNTDVQDTFENSEYASIVVTTPNFEITLSDGVQNTSVARSNANETGTDNIGVKFNKIVIKQIAV